MPTKLKCKTFIVVIRVGLLFWIVTLFLSTSIQHNPPCIIIFVRKYLLEIFIHSQFMALTENTLGNLTRSFNFNVFKHIDCTLTTLISAKERRNSIYCCDFVCVYMPHFLCSKYELKTLFIDFTLRTNTFVSRFTLNAPRWRVHDVWKCLSAANWIQLHIRGVGNLFAAFIER